MREMKISGVDWCHTIPDNWSIIPSKYLFRDSNVRRLDGDIQLTASQKYGIISQVDYMEREQAAIVLANKGLESWKHVEPLDFIISLRSFQGGLEMSEVKGCITWHYVVLKATQAIHHAYYKWLFKSAQYITALQRTCNFIRDGQDLRYSNFAKVPLPYPPVEEQKTIANFLDSKCAEIDALMEDIRAGISTLEEYKKSVITEAVTKGLNPEVEMKDSGVAWVGLMPAKWEVVRLGYICQKLNRKASKSAPILICSNSGKVIYRSEKHTGLTSEKEEMFQGVESGDLLIHGMDTWHGAIAVSSYSGRCTTVVHVCESSANKSFLSYYLQMLAIKKVYKAISNGIRGNTSDFRSWEKTKEIKVALPDTRKEQDKIAEYLDNKCKEIDETVSSKQEQLKVLEEYKKSLIYEYVTGKKEVP